MVPKLRGKRGASLVKKLMHLASVDKVNDLYDRNCQWQGADFAGALLRDIGIDFLIGNPQRLETLPEGPFITVSNHPYGHLDGITLIDVLGHVRPDYKVMVNEILAHIRAMSPNFINVVPKGDKETEPKASSLGGVRETLGHLRDGHAVGFFPSGAVSDLSLKDRCIRDREWQMPVLRLIQKAGVPVVPIRFFDRNSLFGRAAVHRLHLRWRPGYVPWSSAKVCRLSTVSHYKNSSLYYYSLLFKRLLTQ